MDASTYLKLMNKLTPARRAAVLSCLMDGVSIRATSRVTGVAKGTIPRLLESAGTVCAEHQDAIMRNLPCRRNRADEIGPSSTARIGTSPRRYGRRSFAGG